MRIIEIEENKIEHLAEYAEKMLRYGGKLMECIEDLSGRSDMGQREGGRYGNYGSRMYDNREYDRYDRYDREDMGERRGVPGSGRYYR